jgi:DNA polymerase-3 subunit delta'
MKWGLIGHEWAVNLLSEHVASGRERHAYLITGPSGVGRRTLALRFTQSLNCPKLLSAGQPCQTCKTCKHIEQMSHPDLVMVMAAHEGEVLKIDQIRALQHTLSLAPYESRYRVALLLRFEEAHISAANSMLKTLEEPPEHVVVILTANSAENLLPTIVSRCEIIRLRTLSTDETARGLQALKGIPQEVSERLAHISDGRPGYAIRLFEQPKLLAQRQSCIEEMLNILRAPRRERFAFARVLVDDKDKLRDALQVWLTLWRDVLICTGGLNRSITNMDYSRQIENLVAVTDLEKAKFQVNAIERTIEHLDRNVNARQAIEVLLMDFPTVNFIS